MNTYFLQYWKQFIQTKATVTEIANPLNQPQQGNENRHDWRISHNTPYNNNFNCIVRRYINSYLEISFVFVEKKSSNDKLVSAYHFTIVCRPPRLKILILFMTFNILWHFHDLLGTFLTYTEFMKGVEVTLEDKFINPIHWCKYFQGFLGLFSGIFRQDFKGLYFLFFYDPYLDNLPCKFISICHAKTDMTQMQFKNQGATQ